MPSYGVVLNVAIAIGPLTVLGALIVLQVGRPLLEAERLFELILPALLSVLATSLLMRFTGHYRRSGSAAIAPPSPSLVALRDELAEQRSKLTSAIAGGASSGAGG